MSKLSTTTEASITREEAEAMGGLRVPLHPGEMLRLEFMEPAGLTAYALAKATDVPANRITGILHGRRGLTADTALRLSAYFGNSAEFWMNLQASYDLDVARQAAAGGAGAAA